MKHSEQLSAAPTKLFSRARCDSISPSPSGLKWEYLAVPHSGCWHKILIQRRQCGISLCVQRTGECNYIELAIFLWHEARLKGESVPYAVVHNIHRRCGGVCVCGCAIHKNLLRLQSVFFSLVKVRRVIVATMLSGSHQYILSKLHIRQKWRMKIENAVNANRFNAKFCVPSKINNVTMLLSSIFEFGRQPTATFTEPILLRVVHIYYTKNI